MGGQQQVDGGGLHLGGHGFGALLRQLGEGCAQGLGQLGHTGHGGRQQGLEEGLEAAHQLPGGQDLGGLGVILEGLGHGVEVVVQQIGQQEVVEGLVFHGEGQGQLHRHQPDQQSAPRRGVDQSLRPQLCRAFEQATGHEAHAEQPVGHVALLVLLEILEAHGPGLVVVEEGQRHAEAGGYGAQQLATVQQRRDGHGGVTTRQHRAAILGEGRGVAAGGCELQLPLQRSEHGRGQRHHGVVDVQAYQPLGRCTAQGFSRLRRRGRSARPRAARWWP